jgi:AcrR family transcriptional regulator
MSFEPAVEEQILIEPAVSPQKQAILDVAQALFAQHGYEGLSIRDLAEHCGLAKATIYHHFRDKQDLFMSVLTQEMVSMHTRIMLAAGDEQNAMEKLRLVVDSYCEMLGERRSLILTSLQTNNDLQHQLRQFAQTHKKHLLGPLTQIVQQGIDQGIFRPVDAQMSALSLIGMLNAFVAYQLLFDGVALEGDIADHVLSLFLNGILNE